MKFQQQRIVGGTQLLDTNATNPDQCSLIAKIYSPSDAEAILLACNSFKIMETALRDIAASGDEKSRAIAEQA